MLVYRNPQDDPPRRPPHLGPAAQGWGEDRGSEQELRHIGGQARCLDINVCKINHLDVSRWTFLPSFPSSSLWRAPRWFQLSVSATWTGLRGSGIIKKVLKTLDRIFSLLKGVAGREQWSWPGLGRRRCPASRVAIATGATLEARRGQPLRLCSPGATFTFCPKTTIFYVFSAFPASLTSHSTTQCPGRKTIWSEWPIS